MTIELSRISLNLFLETGELGHHGCTSPVYDTTLPPYRCLVAMVNTRNKPSTDSPTGVGAFFIPKIRAASLPSSVWTKPGSRTNELSHSSSALILTEYQVMTDLDAPYEALGTGGCRLTCHKLVPEFVGGRIFSVFPPLTYPRAPGPEPMGANTGLLSDFCSRSRVAW